MSESTAVSKTSGNGREEAALLPPVDVFEDASGITLYADLPGVPRDKLGIQLEGETLTIQGEVELNLPEGMAASFVELGVPRYRRTFTLSRDLDTDKVSAEFKNGVLKLSIPKAAQAQPKRIEVKAA
jgi:HSP20 family molecular chaperone IbpA